MLRNLVVSLLLTLVCMATAATPACDLRTAFRPVDSGPQDQNNNEDDDAAVPPLTQELRTDEGFSLFYPEQWSAAPAANVYQIVNVPADELPNLDAAALERVAQILVFSEPRSDHAEALRRLAEIVAEVDAPATFLVIDGWPALQRRFLAPRPQAGSPEGGSSAMVLQMTTAVAAGDLLVRLQSMVPVDLDPVVADTVETIGLSMQFSTPGDPAQALLELEELQQGIPPNP